METIFIGDYSFSNIEHFRSFSVLDANPLDTGCKLSVYKTLIFCTISLRPV